MAVIKRIEATSLGDGAVEIVVRDAGGKVTAVVTHPFARAPWWFLHRAGAMTARGEKFPTRKAALAACGAIG